MRLEKVNWTYLHRVVVSRTKPAVFGTNLRWFWLHQHQQNWGRGAGNASILAPAKGER